jgi:hypothetical protein
VVYNETRVVVFFLLISEKVFRRFDLQLVSPLKPCDVRSYGVFLESNLKVRVTQSAAV